MNCKRILVVILLLTIVLGLLWIIAMSATSLFGDGFFYHVDEPVSVAVVTEDMVFVKMTRYSRFDMQGVCSHEIECGTSPLVHFPSNDCPLEKGEATFMLARPLDRGILNTGPCVMRGIVTYSPFGRFGPSMQYLWESEEFELVEVKGK